MARVFFFLRRFQMTKVVIKRREKVVELVDEAKKEAITFEFAARTTFSL